MSSGLKIASLMMFAAFLSITFVVWAGDARYIVDLGAQSDYEALRPLIDGCSDLGKLERYRSAIESVGDLEELRPVLENQGVVEFRGCPDVDTNVAVRISR